MNKHKSKSAPGFSNFGFSTILLAFVMICIVTISALSLLTANADYKLSQKVAEKNTAYYEAEYKAYEAMSAIDQMLAKAYAQTSSANNYYREVEHALATLSYGSYERTTGCFTYEIPISENQSLHVTLRILYPKNASESFIEIRTWNSLYDLEAPDDEMLDLIG